MAILAGFWRAIALAAVFPMAAARLADRLFLRFAGGNDPARARALKRSILIHVTVIGLCFLPALWNLIRGVQPYRLPPGGAVQAGGPDKAQDTQRVRRVDVKRRPRLLHNPHSSVAFNFPEVLAVDLRLDKITEHAFTGVRAAGGRGGGGAGLGVGAGKGKGAGYGGGEGEGGKIRFIRLKYDGGDWNRNFGAGADGNMLQEFGRRTGIAVDDKTESLAVRDLLKFPKTASPPFVYLTGEGNIFLSDPDVKKLREYLLERGGMIFADNAGGSFHSAFLSLMRRAVPEHSFVEIPLDDEIFLQPYELPGAPPLWHHSGYRALGLRHQGRWIVFYHQGDMGGAWRDGHSAAPEGSWEAAYEMGVNVMDYAVRHYLKVISPEGER